MANPLDRSITHLLHRASQAASDCFAREADDSDITPRQMAVLTAISADEGASQTDVVAATGIDRSTMADLMRRLIKKGLVKRRRSRLDARAYQLALTGAGEKALTKLTPVLERAETAILQALPAKRRGDLLSLLLVVVARK